MKRSGKFYSKNEKETLKSLGLTPAPQSGAGWVIKEDGENEICMVQLKSTDASSYRIDMLDIKKLEYHASVSNKLPIFLVQFLQQDKIYALVNIEDIAEISTALKTGKIENRPIVKVDTKEVKRKTVKADSKSREQFYKESGDKNRKYNKSNRRISR